MGGFSAKKGGSTDRGCNRSEASQIYGPNPSGQPHYERVIVVERRTPSQGRCWARPWSGLRPVMLRRWPAIAGRYYCVTAALKQCKLPKCLTWHQYTRHTFSSHRVLVTPFKERRKVGSA